MFYKVVFGAATALVALSSFAMAAPRGVAARAAPELSLAAQLQLADTAIERFKLLPDDKDFVFDFTKDNKAGNIASHKNFPALVGTGTSISVGKFEACDMSLLHLHPRAAELQVVLSGRLITEMVPEAGVLDADGKPRVVRTELGPSMMTVFYAGSFHTQMNPDCEPTTFVATFSSEEFGASLVADQTFALSDAAVAATFGKKIAGRDIDAFRDALPKGISTKIDECLAKCGIKKRQV